MNDADKIQVLLDTLKEVQNNLELIESPNPADSYINYSLDVIKKALSEIAK